MTVDLRNVEGTRKPRDMVSKMKRKYVASLTKGIKKGDQVVIHIKTKDQEFGISSYDVRLWLNRFISVLLGICPSKEAIIAKLILQEYQSKRLSLKEIIENISIEVKK